MYVVKRDEMRRIDRLAIEEWGIAEAVLMENAGVGVVEEIKKHCGTLDGKTFIIIAGGGNNGGDGFVIARHFLQAGGDVRLFILGDKNYGPAALANYNIVRRLPIKAYEVINENSLHLLQLSLHYADVVVDALFGIGFQGEVDGLYAEVLKAVNAAKAMKVAVDIPSGVNADSGKAAEVCFHADHTVTFALPKPGLFLRPGMEYAGRVVVHDIGIPKAVYESINPELEVVDKKTVEKNIPLRYPDSHKGSYGHLLVVGGSLGMMGAVNLALRGGFALGAGMVSALVPRAIQAQLAATLPEAMISPVKETVDGRIAFPAEWEPSEVVAAKAAIVFGPGLGSYNDNTLLEEIIAKAESPVVIDADGLNMLAMDLSILEKAREPVIITPHPGEMAALLKTSVADVETDRIASARLLAEEYGIWVVLKGVHTIITEPSGKTWLNPSGSPALATAGTGDVLAGMIGALLCVSENISEALACAVFLHGRAGELAGEAYGEISVKAGDVVAMIPKAIKEQIR